MPENQYSMRNFVKLPHGNYALQNCMSIGIAAARHQACVPPSQGLPLYLVKSGI
jgi:hypothetical protein